MLYTTNKLNRAISLPRTSQHIVIFFIKRTENAKNKSYNCLLQVIISHKGGHTNISLRLYFDR